MSGESKTAPQDAHQERPLWKGFAAGGFGGMCLVAAGYPLDLVKVRLQATSKYRGMVDCFITTVKEEGPLGLYRGMAAPLAGVVPVFALNFWSYDVACHYIRHFQGVAPGGDLSLASYGLAGSMAAFPTTTIMGPGERIKCLLQMSTSGAPGTEKYGGGVWKVAKTLYKEGGLRSIFKGTTATFSRDFVGNFFYFPVFEGVSRVLTSQVGHNPFAIIAGGGLAGMAHYVVSLPLDTIKSRIQTYPEGSFTGMADCARKLIAEEGWGALMKGLGPQVARAFPANAACFLGRDVALRVLDLVE